MLYLYQIALVASWKPARKRIETLSSYDEISHVKLISENNTCLWLQRIRLQGTTRLWNPPYNEYTVTEKNTNKWQHHWLIRGITLSYPNSICLVTDLRPAEEPREPGAEFRDGGLGTTGGRLMSCRELFIRCKADGSDSPLCAVSCENSLPLFGRLDWRLEEDWRRSSRGGVSRAWPTDARQI